MRKRYGRWSRAEENELVRRAHSTGQLMTHIEGSRLEKGEGQAKQVFPGLHRLDVEDSRPILLYVPHTYDATRTAPLALMLHGAGGTAEHGLSYLRPLADDNGLLLLSVKSSGATWDIIADDAYGPDVEFIEQALAYVLERFTVDAVHVAIGGFSDGASYALSLGLANGNLFSHIIAFSPGFMAPAAQDGNPAIYISHGRDDRVLPIDVTSRRIVPRLQRAGYDVRYHEFDGPHTVPFDVVREAVQWFSGSTARQEPTQTSK